MIDNNYLSYIIMLKKLKNRNVILKKCVSDIISQNSSNLNTYVNQFNHIKNGSLKKMNNNFKNKLSCYKQSVINDKIISIDKYIKSINKLSKNNPPKKSKIYNRRFSKLELNNLSENDLIHIIADINKYQYYDIIMTLVNIDSNLIKKYSKTKNKKIIFNEDINTVIDLKKKEMINYILNNTSQSGSGFYMDLESTVVGGLPLVKGYVERNPPVFVDKLLPQTGSGYYYDFGKGALAGRPVTKGYDDHNPPLFMGDLVPKVTVQDRKMIGGGNNIDYKIKHLNNYIKGGSYSKLPSSIKKDLQNL